MFNYLADAELDPIMSIGAEFHRDPRPSKIDLGIGVYRDPLGQTPVMTAVKLAHQRQSQQQLSKSYLTLAGNPVFNEAMIDLVLADSPAAQWATAIQTPGASGALRVVADLLKLAKPNATVWLSDPSYVNHQPIMRAAGLKVVYYPYLNRTTQLVDSQKMFQALAQAGPNDIVVLHGCCHNPSGADLTFADWQQLSHMAAQQGFMPFVDIAYQGFGQGLAADSLGLQCLAQAAEQMVITTSCSKNFGLYRERTGAAIFITSQAQQRDKVRSQALQVARTLYSMAPDHGADIVATILHDPQLKQLWLAELDDMRTRIQYLRTTLTHSLRHYCGHQYFDFINQHRGMFSLTGLTPDQVTRLRQDHGIYALADGRINIAGMNESQVATVAQAIASLQTAH